MKFFWKGLIFASAALSLAAGCVKVDPQVGKGLVDASLLYDTYTAEFELSEIENRRSDALSGYSDKRLALGAIRDETFGLTTRASAFTLIPALDTLDLGSNPTAVKFLVHFASDSVSVADASQNNILQNVYVYALTDTLRTVGVGTTDNPPHGNERISIGVPVINGKDSLSFSLNTAYAQKYVDAIKSLSLKDSVLIDRAGKSGNELNAYLKQRMKDYCKLVPGIYLETDTPAGMGGRISLFSLSCLSVSDNYYARNGNVGLLTVRSTWKGKQKDSTFLFIPGEPTFHNEYEFLSNNQKFAQYAFNYTGHEKEGGKATDFVYVEGGGGLKPVIPAKEIREKTIQEITKHGDAAKAIINKATLLLPFEKDVDYTRSDLYPSILSPTIRKKTTDGNWQFAGLTDASAESENQGSIDRSNLTYAPDFSYHLQEILKRTDLDSKDDADIWLLSVHSETVQNATGSIYDNEYYKQLMYASYYNSLYGGDYYGGYGGYGYGYGGYGYGGYGYGGYNNYYNYLMMAQMMASANQSSTTTTSELDKDRYYCAKLNGPDATSVDPLTKKKRVPRCRVTFSIPRQ